MRASGPEAYGKVHAKAAELSPATQRLAEVERLLDRVRHERSPLTPVLKDLLQAAPGEIALDSLKITEAGALQLSGNTKADGAPTQFAKALAASELLDKVELGDVKVNPKGEGFTFQLTARVKGRAKR